MATVACLPGFVPATAALYDVFPNGAVPVQTLTCGTDDAWTPALWACRPQRCRSLDEPDTDDALHKGGRGGRITGGASFGLSNRVHVYEQPPLLFALLPEFTQSDSSNGKIPLDRSAEDPSVFLPIVPGDALRPSWMRAPSPATAPDVTAANLTHWAYPTAAAGRISLSDPTLFALTAAGPPPPGSPAADNSTVDDSPPLTQYYPIGTRAIAQCAQGYFPRGTLTPRICLPSGEWSGESQHCLPVICAPLVVPKNAVVRSYSRPLFTPGTVATMECVSPLVPATPTTRTCGPTAEWSGAAILCVPPQCPALQPLDGGSFTATAGTALGSTVRYSCGDETTSRLMGPRTRLCTTSGWTGDEPVCVSTSCPAFNATAITPHGHVEFTDYWYREGSLGRLSCDPGYAVIATSALSANAWAGLAATQIVQQEIMCLASGLWSGILGQCAVRDCGTLPTLAGGRVTVEAPVGGALTIYCSRARYSCNLAARTVVGDQDLVCNEDGRWQSALLSTLCPTNFVGSEASALETLYLTAAAALAAVSTLESSDEPVLDENLMSLYSATWISSYRASQKRLMPSARNRCRRRQSVTAALAAVAANHSAVALTPPAVLELSALPSAVERAATEAAALAGSVRAFGSFLLVLDSKSVAAASVVSAESVVAADPIYAATAAETESLSSIEMGSSSNATLLVAATSNSSKGSTTPTNMIRIIRNAFAAAASKGVDDADTAGGVVKQWQTQFDSLPACNAMAAAATVTVKTLEPVWSIENDSSKSGSAAYSSAYVASARPMAVAAAADLLYTPPTCASVLCSPLTLPINALSLTFTTPLHVNQTFSATTIEAATLIPGSTVTVACNADLRVIGPATRTCRVDGTWSETTLACAYVCPDLVVPHGIVSYSRPYRDALTVATLTCASYASAFLLPLPATRAQHPDPVAVACHADGSWSGAFACVVNSCADPALTADPLEDGGPVVHGTVALVVPGKRTYQDLMLTVCETGYSLMPYDASADKFLMTYTPEGVANISSSAYSTVTTANNGTTTLAAGMRVCQASGQWSQPQWRCVRPSCTTLDKPSLGSLTTISSTFTIAPGVAVETSCNSGYALSGERLLICTESSGWHAQLPTCAIQSCPWRPTSSPARFLSLTQVYSSPTRDLSSTVTYSCATGYEPATETLAMTLRCMSGGFWGGPEPFCVPIGSCPRIEMPGALLSAYTQDTETNSMGGTEDLLTAGAAFAAAFQARQTRPDASVAWSNRWSAATTHVLMS